MNMMTFPDEVWDAFADASRDVLVEYERDPLFARINGAYQASLRDSSRWISQSSGVFAARRRRVPFGDASDWFYPSRLCRCCGVGRVAA